MDEIRVDGDDADVAGRDINQHCDQRQDQRVFLGAPSVVNNTYMSSGRQGRRRSTDFPSAEVPCAYCGEPMSPFARTCLACNHPYQQIRDDLKKADVARGNSLALAVIFGTALVLLSAARIAVPPDAFTGAVLQVTVACLGAATFVLLCTARLADMRLRSLGKMTTVNRSA